MLRTMAPCGIMWLSQASRTPLKPFLLARSHFVKVNCKDIGIPSKQFVLLRRRNVIHAYRIVCGHSLNHPDLCWTHTSCRIVTWVVTMLALVRAGKREQQQCSCSTCSMHVWHGQLTDNLESKLKSYCNQKPHWRTRCVRDCKRLSQYGQAARISTLFLPCSIISKYSVQSGRIKVTTSGSSVERKTSTEYFWASLPVLFTMILFCARFTNWNGHWNVDESQVMRMNDGTMEHILPSCL